MEILISTNIDSFIVVVVNVVTWALKKLLSRNVFGQQNK